MVVKKCSDCGRIKKHEDFYVSKNVKDGRMNICKTCHKIRRDLWFKNNRSYFKEVHARNRESDNDRSREYYREHRDELLEYSRNRREKNAENAKNWRMKNKEHCRNKDKERYKANRNKILELNRVWRKSQPESFREKDRKRKRVLYCENISYRENKRKTDAKYSRDQRTNRTDLWLRNKIRQSISAFYHRRYYQKNEKSEYLVGVNLNVAIAYFNSLGYDRDKHDLDHIVPLSAFDIKNLTHRLVMFHYMNMQPLDKYFNRHIKASNIQEGWERVIIKIGENRGVNVSSVINHIENRIASGVLKCIKKQQ